jgi:outer membrane protein TolC
MPSPGTTGWTLFGDPELDALQARLLENSPDLQAAHARFVQAKAALVQVEAARLPTVNVSANSQEIQQARERPLRVLGPLSPDQYRSSTLSFDAAYEFDLWGRVDSLVASGQAQSAGRAGRPGFDPSEPAGATGRQLHRLARPRRRSGAAFPGADRLCAGARTGA